MLRGFISGIIWGLIFCAGIFWVASQMVGVVGLLDEPTGISQEAPSGLSGDISQEGLPEATDTSANEAVGAGARSSDEIGTPAADAGPSGGDGADLPAPSVSTSTDAMTDAPSSDTGEQSLGQDTDALPEQGQNVVPTMPQADEVPQGSMPPPSAEASVTSPSSVSEPSPGTAATVPDPIVDDASADSPPSSLQNPAAEPAPVVDFSAPAVVELPRNAQSRVEPEPEPEPEIADATETPAETGTLPDGRVPVVSAGGAGEGSLLKPVGSLIGNDDEPTNAVDEPDVMDDSAPALVRFAADFDRAGNGPRMSIVLVAGPESALASGQAKLPFPVTYAVDASDEQAGELMRRARQSGQEVVAIAPLPDDASPSDVETSFAVYLARVNEAVAVMDIAEGNFQAGRDVAGQVVAAANEKGLGIITYPRGLNMVIQVAERDGGKAELVFRVFDEGGRDAEAIKRFLDQAAFRAGQQSGVILVGSDTPQTVSALLEWMLGTRASTVTLAPVSAILNTQ